MSIPKVIHYCWFGGNDYSEIDKKCIESWSKCCPDYEIVKWDEHNYDIAQNKFLRRAADKKKWAFVSDFARLDIINKYGGIYLDVDVELLRSYDNFLDCKSFWGIEHMNDGIFVNTGLGFGSEKNNMILNSLMKLYVKDIGENDKLIPCPILQKPVFENLGLKESDVMQNIDGNIFYPSEYFAPMNYETGKINLTENTVSIHHYSSSWKSEEQIEYEKKFRQYSKYFGSKTAEYIIAIQNKFRKIKK